MNDDRYTEIQMMKESVLASELVGLEIGNQFLEYISTHNGKRLRRSRSLDVSRPERALDRTLNKLKP